MPMPGPPDRNALQARVEQALRELPLSEEKIVAVATRVLDSLLKNRKLRPDSSFFDFHGKVAAVADHFAPDGLLLQDYLHAAVRQPSLFYQSPSTLQRNIEQVASHFREHGLTL